MIYNYILEGLNCPNCSAKIENDIRKIASVKQADINLLKQHLVIETEEEIPAIEEKVRAIVNRYEPEVKVVEKGKNESIEVFRKDEQGHCHEHDHCHEHERSHTHDHARNHGHSHGEEDGVRKTLFRFIIGAAVYAAVIISLTIIKSQKILEFPFFIELVLYLIPYIILGYDVVFSAVRNISRGHIFDEKFLMALSSIAAFVIGEYPEAVAVMLFYQLGEFLQDLAVDHSRRNIAEMLNIRPDVANVIKNGKITTISAENVSIGDTIVIKAGERIPVDGIVVEGESMLDSSALTGESLPRSIRLGEKALSGSINLSGMLKVKATNSFKESTASKIIDMVENASSKKSQTENFITKFARYYTPIVVLIALALAVIPPLLAGGDWSEWIRRGIVCLVVSCPCALVISVPLAFFGGIGAASKRGILVKGSNYLEALNQVNTVIFDKTGTLTKGVFKVVEIKPAKGFDEEKLIKYAAIAEGFSNHPIAKSIISKYGQSLDGLTKDYLYEEISGKGVSAMHKSEETKILAGNEKLLTEKNISFITEKRAGTKVYIAVNNTYAGCIVIADEIKEDSKNAIRQLKENGIGKTVMLTGDAAEIANEVARQLQLDDYQAELLPGDKVEHLEKYCIQENKAKKKVAFVGDGINDAPVLARADVGIAMGGVGSDAAVEAADIVIMTDEPVKIAQAIELAKYTRRIVVENIVIALAIKFAFIALGSVGIAGMWEAVFGDVGVAIIACLNSMRLLRK